MKSIQIYDPAMCCSSGVCGPGIDPELVRVSSIVHNLQQKQYDVIRYNLSNEPGAFVANQTVNKLLQENGPEVLPIIVVGEQVVKRQGYPSNQEFAEWTGVSEQELLSKPRIRLELKSKGS
jgi:hypothetical protein